MTRKYVVIVAGNGIRLLVGECKGEYILKLFSLCFAKLDRRTCASMGTAMHYLNNYPEITKSLKEEVCALTEPLDFDELKNGSPILNAFLSECWRMDPPVVLSFRQLTGGDRSHKGYVLPEGTMVALNIFLGTRNEGVYPKADIFSIARFLPPTHPLAQQLQKDDSTEKTTVLDATTTTKPSTYPIFGGGLHSCIGMHFAKLEMRVLITRLLQQYDLTVRNTERLPFPLNGFRNEFQLTAIRKTTSKP